MVVLDLTCCFSWRLWWWLWEEGGFYGRTKIRTESHSRHSPPSIAANPRVAAVQVSPITAITA